MAVAFKKINKLMMASRPGTFATAKNPNNALIRPVQVCRVTSICKELIKLVNFKNNKRQIQVRQKKLVAFTLLTEME